ncbi:uncharacterized protein Dana_GF18904 [Drosophila ananassae]|uniref:Tudor domain-containing protein n=1 Tax=Drosophila ananassae TaxID=7217 RepID=B3M0N1_DROAN|nr:uncharacterized protein LOC6501669 [Drosophila ananassae]EDV44278.2 uncharacterized protein Dana_GF18904 [Drosophila ananassae]
MTPPKKEVSTSQSSEGKGNCVLCADVAERACQRCGDFYCCKECQVRDWQRHRYICFPLPALVHPRSFSLHQATEELSIEGRLAAVADKDVGEAVHPPPSPNATPIRNSDMVRDRSVSSTRSVTRQEYPATPETGSKVPNGSASNYKLKHISNVAMPPSNTLVYLTGFSSSNRCNIRDARENADRAYSQVCEKVNAIGNEMPKASKLHIYGYCLARHNGTFHRAQILNIFGKKDAKLLFVDQGTTKLRSQSDIREINQELLSLPCFSKVVQLKDVPYTVFNDAVAKFLSQFEGEKFVGIYKKTPGHISVDLIHPITKQSLNAQIREFYSDRQSQPQTLAQPTTEVSAKPIQADNIPQTSNKEQQSLPIEIAKNESTKPSNEVQNKALPAELPTIEIKPFTVSEFIKTLPTETGNPLPLESTINKSEQVTTLKESINNAVEAASKPSNMPEPIENVTEEASSAKFNFKPIAYSVDALKSMITTLGKNEAGSITKEEAILKNIINISKESQNQKELEKADDSQKHSSDEKKFPSKEFFENILSVERARKARETSFSISLQNTLDATSDGSMDPFWLPKIEKVVNTASSSETGASKESKSLDNLIKETIIQKKSIEATPETPKTKILEANGTAVLKLEPLLNPPFQKRRFNIESKDGIDVFVVDNSRIARGIFGAFDSAYCSEFSTLHGHLLAITDSKPYKPALREYVIAKYEGSWYRARVEQIKTSPNQQTEYRVLYVDYTNVNDITEKDIRRYPLNFTTTCSTNFCMIEGFPHKPNAAQLSYLAEAFESHRLVHIDSVVYLNDIAMIKSRAIMEHLNRLY